MYKVLVIEDCTHTGSLLTGYINDELQRLMSVVSDPRMVPKNRRGQSFRDDEHEPGQGQLMHIRRCLRPMVEELAKHGRKATELFPTAELFPQHELDALQECASRYTPGYGHAPDDDRENRNALQTFVKNISDPDIVIVDLVMNDSEAAAMVPVGMERFDPNHPAALNDPRAELRKLTGFKILRAFASSRPVIATSHLSNPLIAQHCIVNGAVAFLHKPVPSTSTNNVDFRSAEGTKTNDIEQAAKRNGDVLSVVVTRYLTEASTELAKAMALKFLDDLILD